MTVLLPVGAVLPAEVASVEHFLGRFRERCQVLLAPGQGVVSDAAVEEELIGELRDHFGPVSIRAEESFRRIGGDLDPGHRVLVHLDPLDGSEAYARRSDDYAASVAFEVNGVVMAGCVYHVPSDRMFVAVCNGGATVNGWRLRCPVRCRSRVAVKSTLRGEPEVDALVDRAKRSGYEVHRLGSIALQLCRVANGEAAAAVKRINVRNGLDSLWGVAAGVLICQESGAAVGRLGTVGRPAEILVAANPLSTGALGAPYE